MPVNNTIFLWWKGFYLFSILKNMLKFIKEVFIFSGILIVVLFLLKSSVPYYWGSKWLIEKMEYLEEEGEDFNLYFFGSSLTYRHINPLSFDMDSNWKSFNMGAPSMFYLETHHALDKFITKSNFKKKTIFFIQRQTPNDVADINLHTVRSKYFMDLKRLKIAYKHFKGQSNSKQIYNYVSSYIENLMCIGEIIPILEYHFKNRENLKTIIKKQKGYYSLDQELELDGTKELKTRKEQKDKQPAYQRKTGKINLHKLDKSKIEIAENKSNVDIFLVSGNPVSDYDMYFDRAHYNSKGAELYTKSLARAYTKKLLND